MKTALLALGTLFFIACGQPPCDQLAAKCAACTNTAGKAACDISVAVKGLPSGQDACQAVLNSKTYDADSASCKAN